MKSYGYDTNAMHGAAIFEIGSPAGSAPSEATPDTLGLIVGTSEFVWMSEDDARRICAALNFFSETPTSEIERLAGFSFDKENHTPP